VKRRRNKEPEPESDAPDSDVMTLHEVAPYLHCHQFTVYRLIKTAGLPAFRLGSDWRFRRSDLEKWIDGKTVVVSETKPGQEPKKGKAVKPRKPKPRPSLQRAKKRRV
jgi:excisionase family DNA binding protein